MSAPLFLRRNGTTTPFVTGQSILATFTETAESPRVILLANPANVTLEADPTGVPLKEMEVTSVPAGSNLPTVQVFAVVQNAAKEILIVRRPDGLWYFPGGSMGLGQTVNEMILAQISATTGLVLPPDTILNPLVHAESKFESGTTDNHHFMSYVSIDYTGSAELTGEARWITPQAFWFGYLERSIPSMSSVKVPLRAWSDGQLGAELPARCTESLCANLKYLQK